MYPGKPVPSTRALRRTPEPRLGRRIRLTVSLFIGLATLAVITNTGLTRSAQHLANTATTAAPSADWPTYLHDPARSSASGDTTITTSNVAYLQKKFSAATGGMIAGEPAIVNGIAYIGAWDGYEYAINAATGAVVWKTFLGTITDPPCVPPTMGITSSATVYGGTVYVGGANDSNNQEQWYALSATTGAIQWSVPTGLGTQDGGHYNWASPLVVTDPADGLPYAYVGISSVCDAPLVQGQVLKVSLTRHQIVGTANMVPDGQVGGGIWTTPTYDAATNRVFVSTGTLNLYSQALSQAIVAIDGTTMAVVDHWQLPFEAAVSDSDWGTTPTLTTDSRGDQLLSLANKNGVLYTLNRNNMAAGPIWQKQIAHGGDCPTCGDGSIASGTFANGVLYYAGGSNSDANGVGHSGFVSAFDPGTGAKLWTHETNAPVLGSIIEENGLVFDAQGSVVEALSAASGASLWTYNLGVGTYGAPALARGMLYIGALNGTLYAFGLPATLPGPPPADANCPAGFTCQDIGSPGIAGSDVVHTDGSVSVTAAGNGRSAVEQFRLITKPATGDFQVSVDDISETKGTLTGYSQPQVGIVIRQSAAVGAPFYSALQDPQYPTEGESVANVIMYYRDTWGGPVYELTQSYPQAFPRYIMVQRHGDTFQTLFSTDGSHYTLISGTVHTFVMPTTLMAGVGVASGTTSATTTAVYKNLAYGAPTTPYIEQNEAHPCPTAWNCYDVGGGSPIGDNTLAAGVWTVYGQGEGVNLAQDGIGNNRVADQFHYVYQRMPGDGLLTGRLTALSNGGAAAQATLMMRADTSTGSAFYGVVITPNLAATLQWRTANGIQQRVTIPVGTVSLPSWFRISRFTDTTTSPAHTYFSLLTSTDGTVWTQVHGSTQELSLGAQPLAGIGGSQATPRSTNASTWDHVGLAGGSTAPPGVCPVGFACQDIGTGSQHGNQEYSSGTWSFSAAGADMWDVYDGFHYVSQTLTGDGTVSAQVVSVASAAYDIGWQKSGVMLRQTSDPQSANYSVVVTPQNGLAVQWRATQGGVTTQVSVPGPAPEYPVYLMIGRWTDPHTGGLTYYTGYWSTDNKNFTAIPGSTTALNLPGDLMAGMAADSYNQNFNLAVSFNNFAVFSGTELMPNGACPATVNGCADIGGATPAGTQTVVTTGGLTDLTMNAGGGDIWGTTDQLHYVWQNLAGDGSVSGQVTSQQSTAAWAKAGVMLRQTEGAGSVYYAAFSTPGNGLVLQWRAALGDPTQQIAIPGAATLYLRVARFTDAGGQQWYSAYTSSDGIAWSLVANSTQALAMPGAVLAGWGADAYSQTTASTVAFHAISTSGTSTPPPGLCKSPWTCTDTGGATPVGSQDMTGATWTVQGGGSDIWGNSDQFRLISTPMTGDGTVSARVVSQSNTDPWAKAGVMMRATTDPAAAYYAVLVTPAQGLAIQWRTVRGGTSSQLLTAGSAPAYVGVSRWTDTSGATPVTYYSALTSADGVTWSTVPQSAIPIALPATLVAGVAVTSHNPSTLSAVTFSGVATGSTSAEPPGVCSAAFTCSDIGGPTPAGTQTQTGTAWAIQAGGGDIWGIADQYRYVSKSFPGDGVTSARLAQIGNSSPWAKAGVMVRAGSAAGAADYAVLATPGNGVVVQYRPSANAGTVQLATLSVTTPVYLRIARAGTTFTALTSADGVTWTAVPGSTMSIPALTGSLLAGLAVTSHNTTQLVTAVLDSVVIA